MTIKEEGNQQQNRRLGRGIGALLNVPVRVPQPLGVPGGSPLGVPGPAGAGSTGSDGFQTTSLPKAPSATAVTGVPRGTQDTGGLASVAVAEIAPNPRQPRKDFDDAAIRALSESIRTAGLMQPVVIRRSPAGGSTSFELIAGERRWRAAKLLGLNEIPAVIREVGDQTAAEWALIENIQREDLNPIERSEAIGRLIEEFSLTHQDLAQRIGLDRVTITNLLRLADLDPFTKDAVRRGALSQGHAKVLLGIPQGELRKTLASAAISGGLSVRELERRVRDAVSSSAPAKPKPPALPSAKPHIEDLQRRLSEHLGTKVVVDENSSKKGSGRVIIDYYSFDQFEGLMAKMGFRNEL